MTAVDSTAADLSWTSVSATEPIGLLPVPAGWLVLPGGAVADEVREALRRGRVPVSWPAEVAFVGAALDGDVSGALAHLAGIDGPVAAVDRFVLSPSAEALAALQQSDLPRELAAVVATAAYSAGLVDDPPVTFGLQGAWLALARTVRAAAALEAGEPMRALQELMAAHAAAEPVSGPLAAVIGVSLGDVRQQTLGPSDDLRDDLDAALAALDGADLDDVRAMLHLQRAVVTHELADGRRALLLDAVRHYQAALRTFRSDRHPEQFAFAHTNLALAYLTMPMQDASDHLRLGIAVQSLRSALDVYSPQTHPDRWTSTQLNLANALVHLPSGHREENLREAVRGYEAVLAVRSGGDRHGRARVLANLGTALGHLGDFSAATDRLQQARSLFDACADHDAIDVVDRQLDEIHAHRTAAGENP